MKKLLIVLLSAALMFPSCGQKNTAKEKLDRLAVAVEDNLNNNIVPFWANNDVDTLYGGFFGEVDQKGMAIDRANKGVILNARILWTFSTLYLDYQTDEYKALADRAYNYMKDYFLDREYGGVFYTLDCEGNVVSDQKNVYANAFSIYGFSEYARATGCEEALQIAADIFMALEHAHDSVNGGYNESYTRDWTPVFRRRPGAPEPDPTVNAQNKGMNTSLHVMECLANLYRTWKDPLLETRLREMINIFMEKIYNPETGHQNYTFTPDWITNSQVKSYGHDIECSWLLLESCEILGDEALIEKAKTICLHIAESTRDNAFYEDGRTIYDVNGDEEPSPFLQWWAQAEAVVGCVNAWQLTGDESWLDWGLKIWEYTDKTFVDHEYGEWYYDINREGVLRTDALKVDAWKCPYHNGRMCVEVIRRAKLY